MIKKITAYFGEVAQELSKVSWPSREELFGSTGVVIVLCVILSVFIYSIDLFLNLILNTIF